MAEVRQRGFGRLLRAGLEERQVVRLLGGVGHPTGEVRVVQPEPLDVVPHGLGCCRSSSKKFNFLQLERKYEGYPKS